MAHDSGNGNGQSGPGGLALSSLTPVFLDQYSGAGLHDVALLDATGNEVSSASVYVPSLAEQARTAETRRPIVTPSRLAIPDLLDRYGMPQIAPTIAIFFGGSGAIAAAALKFQLMTYFGDAYELVRRFMLILSVDSADQDVDYCGVTLADAERLYVATNLRHMLDEIRLADEHPAFERLDREYLLRIPDFELDGDGSNGCRPRGMLEMLAHRDEFVERLSTSLIGELRRNVDTLRTHVGEGLPAVWNRIWIDVHASSCGGAGSAMLPTALPMIREVCEILALDPYPIVRADVLLPLAFEQIDDVEAGKPLTYATLTELAG